MENFIIKTSKNSKIYDITKQAIDSIDLQGDGICFFYIPHTTAALVICENEKDLMVDYENIASNLLSSFEPFTHCGHGVPNGAAHIFGALVGCSLSIPYQDGKLMLGKFQSIMLFDIDGGKERKIITCQVKV